MDGGGFGLRWARGDCAGRIQSGDPPRNLILLGFSAKLTPSASSARLAGMSQDRHQSFVTPKGELS